MRKLIFHLAVALITFSLSTFLTKIWNMPPRAESPRQTVHTLPSNSNQLVSSDEPELLDIYNKYAAAQTRHDRAFFERVEADDFRLFAEDRSYSRSEDIELMNSSPADLVYQIEDLKIESQGDAAVVSGRMTATDGHGEVDSWYWIDVCVRRGHSWQIVSTTQAD